MLLFRLLWDPLPDALPGSGLRRLPRLRDLAAAMTADTTWVSEQEHVSRRVRRGAVQALVREAYRAAVAEQDREHLPPAAFTRAWHDHLASLLAMAHPDLPGWGPITIAAPDIDLSWSLYELASRARHDAIEHARASPSRPAQRGQHVPTFDFSVVSEGESLGDVTYGTSQACRTGLLYKIEFAPDWQFCGLGSLALSQLEVRHQDLTWHTTGQLTHARGFYDRYRQGSASPWTAEQHPCPHFD
jgi:hypothetical protein